MSPLELLKLQFNNSTICSSSDILISKISLSNKLFVLVKSIILCNSLTPYLISLTYSILPPFLC